MKAIGELRMKQWLNILIVVCVLLTACSLEAKDIPKTPEKSDDERIREYNREFFWGFRDIKIFDKRNTGVSFVDIEYDGLDRDKLTDYLRLKIKNNFANINIEEPDINKYTKEQIGLIRLRIWVTGENPIVYHLGWKFYTKKELKNLDLDSEYAADAYHLLNYAIWWGEQLGSVQKEELLDTILKYIDKTIEGLAILFYKVRGEL